MKLATKLFLATLVVLALPAMALAQWNFPSASVCDVVADNDNDCVADATVIVDTVCVQGVVMAWKEFGNRGAGAIWDPVNGCCISIFDIDLAGPQNAGDLVEVCGWVTSFAGLAEITDNPANGVEDPSVVLISTGNSFPVTALTAAQLVNGSATAESHESCMISVCGTFELAGGNFDAFSNNYNFIDSQGDTCVVRIDSDTGIGGSAIPAGPVTVQGILGQFDGFLSDCSGYQLLPRSLADITSSNCTVAVDEVPWSDVKARYREED